MTSSSSVRARAAARCCTLAPTGKRILLLERGDYVRARRTTGARARSIVEGRYNTKETWRDRRRARTFTRTRTTTSAATRSSMARRCSDCGARTSARSATSAACRPRGRSRTTSSSRTIPGGRAAVPGARQARRGSDRARASAPYPFPALPHEPRIQQLARTLTRLGPAALPRPARRHARREEPATSSCIRCATCDGFPCLVNAKSDAQVCCVDPRSRAERHVADQRAGQAPGDQRVGARGDGRRRRARWRRESVYAADIVVVVVRRDQLGGAAAALGERSAPARARERLRRGRPPLHGAHQLGPDGGVEVPEPDGLPEDAGHQRLLFRVQRVRVPDGAHLVRRQARRRHAARPARPR